MLSFLNKITLFSPSCIFFLAPSPYTTHSPPPSAPAPRMELQRAFFSFSKDKKKKSKKARDVRPQSRRFFTDHLRRSRQRRRRWSRRRYRQCSRRRFRRRWRSSHPRCRWKGRRTICRCWWPPPNLPVVSTST